MHLYSPAVATIESWENDLYSIAGVSLSIFETNLKPQLLKKWCFQKHTSPYPNDCHKVLSTFRATRATATNCHTIVFHQHYVITSISPSKRECAHCCLYFECFLWCVLSVWIEFWRDWMDVANRVAAVQATPLRTSQICHFEVLRFAFWKPLVSQNTAS